MIDLRLASVLVTLLLGFYLGRRTWRRLAFRCARRLAILWFALLNASFAATAIGTYLTGLPILAALAFASLVVANFTDAQSIRLLGGPDPIRLLQRMHAISERLLPENVTSEAVDSARAWARDLRTVRTRDSRRVIDAVNRAIEAKYTAADYDVVSANAAWEEFYDSIVALKAAAGPGAFPNEHVSLRDAE